MESDSTGDTVKWQSTENPRNQGSTSNGSKRLFFSPSHLDQHWCPSSHLFNGHRENLSRKLSSWDKELTTHPHLLPSLKMNSKIPPLPTHLHGMACTRATLSWKVANWGTKKWKMGYGWK
jgi:hypothetical protein